MAFRKRNVALSHSSTGPASDVRGSQRKPSAPMPGVRPSPIDGRPTTSTGASSLDAILAGHAGLPLGSSLLIEEGGTTDFASVLLRYYAAEGLLQRHHVHVVGMDEAWSRDLPGVVHVDRDQRRKAMSSDSEDKMKIAWRYERLGGVGVERSRPGASKHTETAPTFVDATTAFCHDFDLTKRFTLPPSSSIDYIPVPSQAPVSPARQHQRQSHNPYTSILTSLNASLVNTPSNTVHRVIVPSLLSPLLYPPNSTHPAALISFLHALRALLRRHSSRLAVVISLPLALHPRTTGITRWSELLSDGVVELAPFPHLIHALGLSASGTKSSDEKPQGMFRVWRLPVWHERGGGCGGAGSLLGEDLAFTLTRRSFKIKPYNLPPVEGDEDARRADNVGSAGGSGGSNDTDAGNSEARTKVNLDF
ncbi:Elongator complex protein 4 [Lineolata rhizophorae]|uniref:Elongator complex protein 4 n=1 Tax=Lineolata rhizophorae TaxID=578093 RepID=A0A6A6P739_9PEZI|nr:Elongator complex protein 4 [Lineolata rhizophorae]